MQTFRFISNAISSRERILHFTCSLDLPDGISMDTAYNMFSKNLSRASILTYVYIMNVTDMDVEVDFLLGNEDKTQWTVSIQIFFY